FSSRRRHTSFSRDWSSDVCSSDLGVARMRQARFLRWILAAVAAAPAAALAQSADPTRWQLNMGRGVTSSSQNAYDAHMLVLWICVAIGVVVFGAMAYAMFAFRKSK